MRNLRQRVSVFVNCWVEERDEQEFSDISKKSKKGTIVTAYLTHLESTFPPGF